MISETEVVEQEQGGDSQEAILAAASETEPVAQDTIQAPPPPPAPAVDEVAIEKRYQAIYDRRLDQERRRLEVQMQQQQQQAAQAAAVAEMDDEEFGRFMRENQRAQQATQAQIVQTLRGVYSEQTAQVLGIVSDSKARQEVEERNNKGEFKSFGEFLHAAQEAELGARIEKSKAELEKQIRETVQKEMTAQNAASGGVVLGSGMPTLKFDFEKLSPKEKIKAALREEYSRAP